MSSENNSLLLWQMYCLFLFFFLTCHCRVILTREKSNGKNKTRSIHLDEWKKRKKHFFSKEKSEKLWQMNKQVPAHHVYCTEMTGFLIWWGGGVIGKRHLKRKLNFFLFRLNWLKESKVKYDRRKKKKKKPVKLYLERIGRRMQWARGSIVVRERRESYSPTHLRKRLFVSECYI